MNYVILDGTLRPASSPLLSADNRAFNYGDAVFETMRYRDGRILFAEAHWKRLQGALRLFRLSARDGLTRQALVKRTAALVKKNGIAGDARIRLTVFREAGGHYIPSSRHGRWLLTAAPLPPWQWPRRGLRLGFAEGMARDAGPQAKFKTGSAALFVLAGWQARSRRLDDLLLLNARGRVTDAISANVFTVKGGRLATPPLKDGCVDGVMRGQVTALARRAGLPVTEKSLKPADILAADEVFLTNAVSGIRWVRRCGAAAYGHAVAENLFGKLSGLFG
jgi:branched-chain amino acid aminotransferase